MSSKHQRSKRARRGDRSFQPGSAGKGDADRTTDKEAFDRGYDAIDWGRPKQARISWPQWQEQPRPGWKFDWSEDV